MNSSKTWRPDRPTSQGATAYHDAVVNTSWHKENINGLIKLVRGKIKPGDSVVDFGAGTGASAVYLLKTLHASNHLSLVDNSPSWLGKAYELLSKDSRASFFVLEKKSGRYMLLDEVLGKTSTQHVISANTVHLIPEIKQTFDGIYRALQKGGTFSFQSGNIKRTGRPKDVFMIDNSVTQIHDLAIKGIRTNKAFLVYKKDLATRLKQERAQRLIIFPKPRPVEFYVKSLKSAGFKHIVVTNKRIPVKYADWLQFVRVRRLQAGILPEVGGKDATPQQEKDRDALIAQAAKELFNTLKTKNRFATSRSFMAEWIYIQAKK